MAIYEFNCMSHNKSLTNFYHIEYQIKYSWSHTELISGVNKTHRAKLFLVFTLISLKIGFKVQKVPLSDASFIKLIFKSYLTYRKLHFLHAKFDCEGTKSIFIACYQRWNLYDVTENNFWHQVASDVGLELSEAKSNQVWTQRCLI